MMALQVTQQGHHDHDGPVREILQENAKRREILTLNVINPL